VAADAVLVAPFETPRGAWLLRVRYSLLRRLDAETIGQRA
jgi:hypothetical protein